MASMSDDLTALEERFNLRLAAELADVRTEMRTGFAEVRTEVRTGFAEVRTEIADLRGDLEAKLRSQTWAMVSTLVGVSGLVFTLARFT
jgi:hypothetical protein